MTDLEFIESLARQAGLIQLTHLKSALTVEHKLYDTDLITTVDRSIDQLLVSELRQRFPTHAIISEEGDPSHQPRSEQVAEQALRASSANEIWYVDPLDGTTNYAHGYPVFAVSLGLQRGHTMVLGVVYDPSRDELFSAERGAGAFLNGRRLHVSPTAWLSHALISTGFHYDRVTNPDNNFRPFAHVTRRAQSVRRGGAAAIDLANVAAGRLDGHWERLAPWDCAAAALLITEAGGKVSGINAEPWSPLSRWTVATNGLIHAELLAAIQ